MHFDLYGLAPIESNHSFKYYINFLDDYSHFSWIFPLKTKGEVLSVFKQFKIMVEKLLDASIKTLHTDGGGEFMAFGNFLKEQGITHLFSCPYTSEQNGRVERKHRHIVESRLSLLAKAKMPLSFWWDAFHTSTYNINRLPTFPLQNKSPFEALFNKKPDYNLLHPFGCAAFPCLTPYNNHKLQFHSQKCLFIGYSNSHKEYICLASSGRVYLSRHVIFNHNDYPYGSLFSSHKASDQFTMQNNQSGSIFIPSTNTKTLTSPSAEELNTHSNETISASPIIHGSHNECLESSSTKYMLPSMTERMISSGSSTDDKDFSLNSGDDSSSTRYMLPHSPAQNTARHSEPVRNTHQMVTRSKAGISKPKVLLATVSNVPSTIQEALANPIWFKAMTEEYSALQSNNTWTLVPATAAMHVVGSKWIFKVKYKADGSIERHKARLVAQGFTQTAGFDYFDTFSPIVKPATIRIFLTIAATLHWPVHQLDINNAFLNGNL